MATKKKVRVMSNKERVISILLVLGILVLTFLLVRQNGLLGGSLTSSILNIPSTTNVESTTYVQTTEMPITSGISSSTEPDITESNTTEMSTTGPNTTEVSTTTEPETTEIPTTTANCPDATVTITWDANPETDIAGYVVGWSEAPTPPFQHAQGTEPAMPPIGTTVQTEMTLTLPAAPLSEGGKTYYFRVSAYNKYNLQSEFSNEVSITLYCDDHSDVPIDEPTDEDPPTDENPPSPPIIIITPPYPGIPGIVIPPPPPTFDCPPPKVVHAKITKILSIDYSFDLQSWTTLYSAPVPDNFDLQAELAKLRQAGHPTAYFRVNVEYDYVCEDAPTPAPSRPSGVQSSLQSSALGGVSSDSSEPTVSWWSRLMSFLSSLFSFSSLQSDVLGTTPSQPKNISVTDIITRNIQVLAKGASIGDTFVISGDLGIGTISDLNIPLKTSVLEGTHLDITAIPGPNSTFKGWTGGCRTIVGNTCSFVVTRAKGITATFEAKRYTITTTTTGTGTGTISGNSSPYLGGAIATLTATPAAGSLFTSWLGCSTSKDNICNLFVNADKTVSAQFTALPKYTLTTTKAGIGGGTITTSVAGINCGTDCSEQYSQNTLVTLIASPSPLGSIFTGWSGACVGSGSCIVAMNSNKTVMATFATIPTYTLSVAKTGTGTGSITSSVAGINCGTDCSEIYNQNTSITLTATPDSGMTFAGWSGCNTVSNNTCTVSMSAAKTVTATFTKPSYTLTVTKAGIGTGTIISSSGSYLGSGSTLSYTSGITTSLTAIASTGSIFTGWSGACTGTGICSILMSSNKTVTANFSLPSTYTVRINVSGTGTGLVRWGTVGGKVTGTFTSTKTLTIQRGASFQCTVEPYQGTATPIITGDCKTSTSVCSCTIDGNKTIDVKLNKI